MKWPVIPAAAVLLSTIGCASLSNTPIAVSENVVYSPPLQVTVTKPSNWEFVSAAIVRQRQKSTLSNNALLNYLNYQGGLVPFVAIGRSHPAHTDFRPTFAIFRESLGEERLATNQRALALVMGDYAYVLKNARPVGSTYPMKIGGLEYECGTMHLPLGFGRDEYAIELKLWVRATGISATVIMASYDLRDQMVVQPEVDQIVRSITAAPQRL